MNQITINFDDREMSMSVAERATFEQILLAELTAISFTCEQLLKTTPETDHPAIKASIADMINTGLTNVLESLGVGPSTDSTLTEIAILLAENKIMRDADANGMTLQEYLPLAREKEQKEFDLFRRNEEGQRRHNRKRNAEQKPNNVFKLRSN